MPNVSTISLPGSLPCIKPVSSLWSERNPSGQSSECNFIDSPGKEWIVQPLRAVWVQLSGNSCEGHHGSIRSTSERAMELFCGKGQISEGFPPKCFFPEGCSISVWVLLWLIIASDEQVAACIAACACELEHAGLCYAALLVVARKRNQYLAQAITKRWD